MMHETPGFRSRPSAPWRRDVFGLGDSVDDAVQAEM